jgi:hypothetical protein
VPPPKPNPLCRGCGKPVPRIPGRSGKPNTWHAACKPGKPLPAYESVPTPAGRPELFVPDRPGAIIPVPPPASPFNSTPVTAPLPPAPPAQAVDGLLTTSIREELASLVTAHPLAGTLKAAAIQVAQAADAVPADDLKGKLLAIKNVRDIIKELAAAKAPGGDDDDNIFGAVRPEMVNAPTV